MKHCNKCNADKNENDFYLTKKGLTHYCKECLKQSARDWVKNNPEKNKLKQRKWNKEHPEDASIRNKKSRDKNPEVYRQKSRDWKKRNPEKHRQWAIDHPEKVNASRKQYLHKRRAIKKETDITINFLVELKEQTEICSICNKKMLDTSIPYHPDQKQLDHIIPLSIGGKHIKENVRYVCGSCNNHRPRKGQDL